MHKRLFFLVITFISAVAANADKDLIQGILQYHCFDENMTAEVRLSDYINNTLHTTFYDFINTYRITEARLIIEAMPQEGRKSMAVVAEMSGFNSLSTFNRHFVRVVGISPKQYYTDSLKKEYINQ